MSRRSWKNLLRSKSKQQPKLVQARRVRPDVEQLEELTLPSGGKAFPMIMVAPHRPQGGGGIHPQIGGLTPAQIRGAYGIDRISFNGVVGDGTGQTIAIVDAYDDPNAASDLGAFISNYSLQTMFGAGGKAGDPVFTKVGVDSSGNATSGYPLPDAGWAGEIALDIEWSHVVAPKANIVLVEGASASNNDLLEAVQYASTQTGAGVVSMSWGEGEFFGEDSYDSFFSTPGVTYFAASGDSGSPIIWPAASSHVVGAGGTSLSVGANNTYGSESGWSGSGGGLSAVITAPSYQNGLVISDGFGGTINAGGMRASPDVAYNADPSTGVPILDTYGFGGWVVIGGTSAASPQWAALVAIADQGRALAGQGSLTGFTDTLPALYQLPSGDYHDVTSGSNGGYFAGPGYDLVTGRGSPVANLLVPALAGFSPGQPPSITNGASFTLNPAGTSAQLTVGATGNPASDPLIYTWSVVGTPPAPVSFSPNGTGASSTTTATFSAVGTYTLQVTVTDTVDGLSATSQVSVPVTAITNTVTVSPTTASVYDGNTQQFTATAFDQFGAALAFQPSFSWAVTSAAGTGSVTASGGLYTAPATGTGSATVQATGNGVSGTATVSFTPAPPPPVIQSVSSTSTSGSTTATLTVTATDAGGTIVSYTWVVTSAPAGAAVTISPNGNLAAATATATFGVSGSYTFQVTVTDSNNLTATSSTSITIAPVLSYVVVAPSNVTLAPSGTQQFTATPQDQFHKTFSTTATTSWQAISGGITTAGLYTAPSTGSSDTVTATIGGVSGTASVTITSTSGVLFSDNFATGMSKWTVHSGSYLIVPHGKGTNRLESYNYGGVNRIVAGSSSWTNYSYQGIVTFLDTYYGSASLLARVVDDNHLYFFSYNAYYGVWQIARKDGPYVTTVVASSLPYTAYYYTDYTVQANLYGNYLSLYVNGVFQVSVTDGKYSSGKIGFSTTNATATLGNVVVTALNGPLVRSPGGSPRIVSPTPGNQQSHFPSAPFKGVLVSGYVPLGGLVFSSGFSLGGVWEAQPSLAAALGEFFWDVYGKF
jgi:subtilase family serine protease